LSARRRSSNVNTPAKIDGFRPVHPARTTAAHMANPILANHAHVFPADVNPDATIDRLLQLLDACGIAQAICFSPFATQVQGYPVPPNRWLARELRGRDRLYGFGTIDLRRADIKDQVREVADLGFRGIKLHPNTQKFDILGEAALQVYAAAEEAGLFLTFHSGVHHYRLDHYRVLKFDEVAYNFPRLRMSLEHVGGYHFFNEALAVIFNNIPFPPIPGQRGRVYGGLTSVFTPHYVRFWYLPKERLLEAIEQVGADHLIFGLDFPYNLEENTMTALRTINEILPNEADRDLVLGGNLRRELSL
jgi:predicted TIM-barrel fold metal-dependent hydrolase